MFMRPLTLDELIVTFHRFTAVIDYSLDLRDRRGFERAAVGRGKILALILERMFDPTCACDGKVCTGCEGPR